MGIDRIGKGGPTLPTNTTAEVGKSGQSFEAALAEKVEKAENAGSVSAVEAPASSAASASSGSSPLEKLRAGQIDLNGYLDLKIDQATSHLRGLGPNELDAIKRALREQLVTDPTLSDLVKGAAGQTPVLPDGA